MVAASKLRKAQEAAEASKPYAETMEIIMRHLASRISLDEKVPKLLTGTGEDKVHLVIVLTANKGLCGAFNSNVVRLARRTINKLLSEGKEVKIVCIGRKGRDVLKREYGELIIKEFLEIGDNSGISYADVAEISRFLLKKFDKGEFDICSLVHNRFKNVLVQLPVVKPLIPLLLTGGKEKQQEKEEETDNLQLYSFEPSEPEILGYLLPRNISAQLYQALIDGMAGEQAARMTAMDNSTSAAGDMIDKLTLFYNRERQAVITNELIEIVSGAEAL